MIHFSGVLAAWSRAPLRIGFKINALRNPLYTHLVSYDLDGREDAQFGRLLNVLCGKVVTLPPKNTMLANVAQAILPVCTDRIVCATLYAGRAAKASFAVVHTGGTAPAKRWAAENYAALCDRLELPCAIIGGKEDCGLAAEVARLCRTKPLNLCGQLTLPQSAELCRRATVFVGTDSGMAHVANATGVPCVVLFGPSDPLKWGPEQGSAIRVRVPCGPCAIFGYNKPCRIFSCMKAITVDAVVQEVQNTLKKG